MVDFLTDTKDLIEKNYGEQVLSNYPNYSKIWEEIIGVREVSGQFLPWDINFSKCGLNTFEQNKFKKIHEQICMALYSQFCYLVGAHYQLEEAEISEQLKNDYEKAFKFWESFDNFYQHLGNVRFQLFHTRDCFNSLGITNIRRTSEDLEEYFNNKGKNSGDDWRNVEEEVISIRNYFVHFARIPSIGNQIYAVPLIIPDCGRNVSTEDKPIWSDTLSTINKGMIATIQMKNILTKVEKSLNKINGFFLDDFLNYMDKNLIFFRKVII